MVSPKTYLHPAAIGLLILGFWVLVTSFGWVDPIILPSPLSVLCALPPMFREDRLAVDMAYTVGRVVAAVTLAGLAGIPLGLLFGYRKSLYHAVEAPLHALRSLPASALFPLFLVVIGVGEASIVALAAYPSLLIMLVNATSGASLANRRRLHQARLLGLSAREIVTEFLFFEALPSILTGLRTAVSYALVLVIAVEMFIGIGANGIGRKIYLLQSTYQIPKTYAAIALAGVVGITANLAINMVERRVLRWMPHTSAES